MATTTEAAVYEDNLFIPLIDFSLFLHGNREQRQAVAKEVVDGFKNAGFVYLKNHGIPADVVKEIFSQSTQFFRLPQEEKDKLAWYSPQSNRGYVTHGREKTTKLVDKDEINALRARNPDLKESMEIGRDNHPKYPNMWPPDEKLKNFKEVMSNFFNIGKEMHVLVMRSIGLGLGLEEKFFDQYCDGGDNNLRLLHYPACPKDVFKINVGQVRAGEHTDLGSITLLFQDDKGGLQVRSPNGTFVNATPIPDTIVVNAGDLLARWSNGIIKSTEHRVTEPPSAPDGEIYPARYSCAYFCNPNFDKWIEALPNTYTSEADKKWPGIYSGDYVAQRLGHTYS